MSDNGIFRECLDEIVDPSRRLGRHVVHDPRSKDYPAPRAPQIVSVKHTAVGLPLNQGQIGSCTANALCGALDSAPNLNGGPRLDEKQAIKLYKLETQLEGRPYPPDDPGGSGLMVCKAAKEMGLISTYRHAFGIQHALEALVERPVITGINWYDSFDTPYPSGLVEIAPGAKVRGGHEIVADEIQASKGLVWFWNSWGAAWGAGGRLCMTFDTWDRLLQENGDVTVPIK
jgi:hypothetical protein